VRIVLQRRAYAPDGEGAGEKLAGGAGLVRENLVPRVVVEDEETPQLPVHLDREDECGLDTHILQVGLVTWVDGTQMR
jgi:hypothetical protein